MHTHVRTHVHVHMHVHMHTHMHMLTHAHAHTRVDVAPEGGDPEHVPAVPPFSPRRPGSRKRSRGSTFRK